MEALLIAFLLGLISIAVLLLTESVSVSLLLLAFGVLVGAAGAVKLQWDMMRIQRGDMIMPRNQIAEDEHIVIHPDGECENLPDNLKQLAESASKHPPLSR